MQSYFFLIINLIESNQIKSNLLFQQRTLTHIHCYDKLHARIHTKYTQNTNRILQGLFYQKSTRLITTLSTKNYVHYIQNVRVNVAHLLQ